MEPLKAQDGTPGMRQNNKKAAATLLLSPCPRTHKHTTYIDIYTHTSSHRYTEIHVAYTHAHICIHTFNSSIRSAHTHKRTDTPHTHREPRLPSRHKLQSLLLLALPTNPSPFMSLEAERARRFTLTPPVCSPAGPDAAASPLLILPSAPGCPILQC